MKMIHRSDIQLRGNIVMLDGEVEKDFFTGPDRELDCKVVTVINASEFGDVDIFYAFMINDRIRIIEMYKAGEDSVYIGCSELFSHHQLYHDFDKFEDHIAEHHIDEISDKLNLETVARIGDALYNTIAKTVDVGSIAIDQFESRSSVKNARSC